MLECDYCGTSYTVKEIEGIYANKDAVAEAQASKNLNDEGEYSTSGENWGAEGMKVYSCPS
jgi:hypothetical protein